jgi:transcriptional regulator GlxA family with amidase domain
MDPRIKRALEIIEEKFTKPLHAQEVAEALGLSVSRFEHLFREEMGCTFTTYVREVRLRKAKPMLVDRVKRVEQVATDVGYNYARNFTRDFTKRNGKSPSHSRALP